MRALLIAALAALAAAPVRAADAKAKEPRYIKKPADPAWSSAREPNYKISFKMKAEDLEGAGSFLVEGGHQGSYNVGAESPKRVLTANCVPSALANEPNVRLECQFELSGALPAEDGKKPKEPVTLQYQGTFVARLGRTLVLVDAPLRHLEIVVEDMKLPQ